MEEGTRLSPIKKIALSLLDIIREQIVSDCDEDELAASLAKFHPERHGYVKESDFINYDEAMDILHLGRNRVKLKQLCDSYGIKNIRFNNMYIGFPRRDIERLAQLLSEECKAREKKQKRKEGQHRFLY